MDVQFNGAKILFTIPIDVPGLGPIPITQTLVISWVVMALITGACIWLGSNLQVENISKRQAVAEMLVETLNNFVHTNMGPTGFDNYIPLVGALFATSVVSNLISLTGVWSPTADLSTEAAWAIVVYILITRNKLRTLGLGGYLRGFLDPIFVMAPLNVLSEFSTPVSMACRHFGNILSGMVISSLIYAALAAASHALFALLGSGIVGGAVFVILGVLLLVRSKATGKFRVPGLILTVIGLLALLVFATDGVFAQIPWLDFGLPAVFSLYFDWFSGCIQAFIFCTLTTIFIKSATES